jgi:hypothetical protein
VKIFKRLICFIFDHKWQPYERLPGRFSVKMTCSRCSSSYHLLISEAYSEKTPWTTKDDKFYNAIKEQELLYDGYEKQLKEILLKF